MQISSELWFSMATVSSHRVIMYLHFFSVVFHPIIFILAGNKDMHGISDEFEIQPDTTTTVVLPALGCLKTSL